MHLHNGVLDVGRSRGSYGSLAFPWPTLLVALVLGLGALGMLVCSVLAWGAASAFAADASSEHYLTKGWQSFQRGDFEQAVVSWGEAARRAEKAQQPKAQSVALTHVAQAYQALGHYRQRCKAWKALALAQRTADRAQIAAVLGSLGNIYIATGPADQAEQLLREALRLAQELGTLALPPASCTTSAICSCPSRSPRRRLVSTARCGGVRHAGRFSRCSRERAHACGHGRRAVWTPSGLPDPAAQRLGADAARASLARQGLCIGQHGPDLSRSPRLSGGLRQYPRALCLRGIQ